MKHCHSGREGRKAILCRRMRSIELPFAFVRFMEAADLCRRSIKLPFALSDLGKLLIQYSGKSGLCSKQHSCQRSC